MILHSTFNSPFYPSCTLLYYLIFFLLSSILLCYHDYLTTTQLFNYLITETFNHLITQSLTHSLTHFLTLPLTHPSTHSHTLSLTHPSTHSLTRSHTLTQNPDSYDSCASTWLEVATSSDAPYAEIVLFSLMNTVLG